MPVRVNLFCVLPPVWTKRGPWPRLWCRPWPTLWPTGGQIKKKKYIARIAANLSAKKKCTARIAANLSTLLGLSQQDVFSAVLAATV